MPRRVMLLMSTPHHSNRSETRIFNDILNMGIKNPVLENGVSKVNKFKNRGIKIVFKPNF